MLLKDMKDKVGDESVTEEIFANVKNIHHLPLLQKTLHLKVVMVQNIWRVAHENWLHV